MINQESRRLDAEKIRQEFVKSTRLKITPRPGYPQPVQQPQSKQIR
jgi:hypothetical protein